MKAMWFSRHQPSREQIEDAARRGYEITEIDDGMAAGAVALNDEPAVWRACEKIEGRVVFGVFPAPMRAQWLDAPATAPVEAWEAWNESRTPEVGKPTFVHRAWVRVYSRNI
jgi:hypothetical protein